jgi:hypothetical protein
MREGWRREVTQRLKTNERGIGPGNGANAVSVGSP